jgi:hypothetical protein
MHLATQDAHLLNLLNLVYTSGVFAFQLNGQVLFKYLFLNTVMSFMTLNELNF